jgi:hypothetical protein
MMPRLGAAEVAAIGVAAATVAARSQFEDLGAAALLQREAQAIGATAAIGAAIAATATGIGATVSVRQR